MCAGTAGARPSLSRRNGGGNEEPAVFTTLVLICSMAAGADLRDCGRSNPLVLVEVPDPAARSCLMHRPPEPEPAWTRQSRRRITT